MADCVHCVVCGARRGNAAKGPCPACALRTAINLLAEASNGPAADRHHLGPYEILGEIARGGMGIVYRARQHPLQRLVALKVIQGATFASPEKVRRFMAEAELAAALDHPNIVPIHEVGDHDGQPYFSMGLVEGETLADTIARSQPSRDPESAQRRRTGPDAEDCRKMAVLVAKVARAVQYAHERGVLHRDLKPTNVLIDAAGEPRLTDFGLAKLTHADSSLTHTHAILGTPSFMAPEQARGGACSVTIAADIYGLGALLYTALTGSPPFAGATPVETLRQVLESDPLPLSQLRPAIDRDLETVCLHCLEKEPARRYASAQAVAEDLERWLRHEPILARPSGPWERTWKLCRRHPFASALTAGLALSLVAALTGVLWQWRRAEGERREAVAARVDARRESYFAGIALAQRHLEDGDVLGARRRLLELPAEFRHWEWGHLVALCHGDLATVHAGARAPAWVAWSPDGTRLATVAGSRARFWHALDPNGFAPVEAPADPRFPPAFVLGGSRVALVVSNALHLVDPDSGLTRESISLPEAPLSWDAASTGERALTLHADGRVILWRLPGGQELGAVDSVPPLAAARFSLDGRRVLGETKSAEGRGLRLFDSFTGNLLQEVLPTSQGAEDAIFADAGNHHAWRANQRVFVGGTNRSTEALPLAGTSQTTMALSPDGRFLLLSEFAGTTRGWDLVQHRPTFTTPERVDAAAFSPNPLYASVWGGGGSLGILDLTTGEILLRLRGQDGTGHRQRYSPDGRFLATSARDGTVQLWSARPGRSRLADEDLLRRLAISPDGRWGVTGFISGAIAVWETTSGQPVRFPDGHLQWILCVAFAPHGGVFATGSADRTARLWDTQTGAELRSLPHPAAVSTLAFSRDGSRLVTGDRHGGLHLWDPQSGATLARTTPGHGPVIDVAMAGDDLAVAFTDGTVALWSVASLQPRRELGRHASAALTVTFSPDGTTLASTGSDRRLLLWDVRTGRLTHSTPTRNQVYRLAFCPDGARLVTGSNAERGAYDYPSLDIWDVATARPIVSFRYDNGQIHSASFSPDGRSVFAGHARQTGTAYVFQRESFPWVSLDPGSGPTTAPEFWIGQYARQYWRQRLTDEDRPPTPRPNPLPLPRSLWPPRPASTPVNSLDLTPQYNALLGVPWRTLGVWQDFDDDLSTLPAGLHSIGGITFDVRGLIVAPPDEPDWRRLRFYANPVGPIEIRRPFRRLHFLHATTFRAPEGAVIGHYQLRYVDGSFRQLPLVYGGNLRSWQESPPEPTATPAADRAWRGTNATASLKGATLRLFHWTWIHPEPDRTVATLQLQSAPGHNAAPFLVAVTAE